MAEVSPEKWFYIWDSHREVLSHPVLRALGSHRPLALFSPPFIPTQVSGLKVPGDSTSLCSINSRRAFKHILFCSVSETMLIGRQWILPNEVGLGVRGRSCHGESMEFRNPGHPRL